MQRKLIWVFVISFLLYPVLGLAFCFEEAAKEHGIEPIWPYLITKIESNFKPDAINYNGNGSYDYGLMQINSSWAKEIGPVLWASLGDPCTNVKVGTWILADCIKQHGKTWRAIGCYNAKSPEKRVKYEKKVRRELAKLVSYKATNHTNNANSDN